ncbi:cobalamin-5-phosphate synthase [Candidatus Magnetomorum sp. HK-1]|nr:cobalamin-5-phosphate synthase [Candidatus Magnetomorum sp. HK-1]
MNPILNEWRVFNHAIIFFTQIPLLKSFQYTEINANKAIRYLPVIGCIVGLWAALIFFVCKMIFPLEISVFLSMLATILLTGALHEDGFADFCDSLGGMTLEKKLSIMKDSNMGAFGVIGIIGILFGKFLFLIHLPASHIPAILISGHVISRFVILFFMLLLPYAGEKKSSKSLTIVENKHLSNILIAFIFTVFIHIFMPLYTLFSIPIIACIIIFLFYFYKKNIGGYTGDYLGAAQQLIENAHYLSMVYWFKMF